MLEKIFYQFCNLSLAPVTMVHVFDGPRRPDVKRGTRVISRSTWLEEQLKRMITYFGFHFYEARFDSYKLGGLIPDENMQQAPGETEAELAQLNANGRIDGIITEDSDAFLFGARRVGNPARNQYLNVEY